MNTSILQTQHTSIATTLFQTKMKIGLHSVVIEYVDVYILRNYLLWQFKRGLKKIIPEFNAIYETIPSLNEHELESMRKSLVELSDTIRYTIEDFQSKPIFSTEIRNMIDELDKKTDLYLEMVEINLDHDLINELNEAIREVNS